MEISKKISGPRGHHFQSQCYLKGFTKLCTKNSQLIVLDIENRKVLPPGIPVNFCKKRDFNRIELEGVQSNSLELQLAEFETRADRAIQNILRIKKFEGKDRDVILTLMALFAIRNPWRRTHTNNVSNS